MREYNIDFPLMQADMISLNQIGVASLLEAPESEIQLPSYAHSHATVASLSFRYFTPIQSDMLHTIPTEPEAEQQPMPMQEKYDVISLHEQFNELQKQILCAPNKHEEQRLKQATFKILLELEELKEG